MLKEITSVKNPAVKAARELETMKGRREQQAFLCDGEHMVGEALQACPEAVSAVFVDDTRMDAYAGLLTLVSESADIYRVPAAVLEAVSQVKTPQGIAAVCALPKAAPLEMQCGRLLLLENVQDPGNVGTILRTLDAAGFNGCVLTAGCADPYAPKTLRATMGSIFRVPISFAAEAGEAVERLNALGYHTLGAALDGEPFYQRQALPERVCVLIGNEGAGLSQQALLACSRRYRLPMQGGAESLNAAIAAAVMMYDIMNR